MFKSAIILLLMGGCAHRHAPPIEATIGGVPAEGDSLTLPTPFTPNQIRIGMPRGTHIRFEIGSLDQAPVVSDWRVLDATETDMELEESMVGPDGAPIGEAHRQRYTWVELCQHAAFPADKAVRMEAQVQTPHGTLPAWLYEVKSVDADGTPYIERYYFARAMPGPPVLVEASRGSVVLSRMKMVSNAVEVPIDPGTAQP